MDRRLSRLINALGPVMTPLQAEGFLHVTAFTCRKSLETLSAEDWPAIEAAVREALQHSSSVDETEAVVGRMRTAFLEGRPGSEC
jgi:hypothetical protein